MKIQNLKTKVISPMLLLIPTMCMHLGDGHHTGPHHSTLKEESSQSRTSALGGWWYDETETDTLYKYSHR